MKVIKEQGNSSISQYFTIGAIRVDPDTLTSEVSGTLHTVVGSKAVTAEHKRFRFTWKYSGLSLQLIGFGMISKAEGQEQGEEA
jgi:conjugal transfer pilus assembly protein TraE